MEPNLSPLSPLRLRPTHTDDLVQRLDPVGLIDDQTPSKYTQLAALQALSRDMIDAFQDAPNRDDVRELVALSTVITGRDYRKLVESLVNAVGNDDTIPNLNYLIALRLVLRGDKCIDAKPRLTLTFSKLLEKLNAAGNSADHEMQYVLVCTAGTVLDAIHDIRVEGIDRETIHSPLYEKLRSLADEDSLRLSQAASYALQGLARTPDNEATYEKLGRIGWKVVSGVAKVAGGVAKMDPSQILDSLPDLAKIPDLASTLYSALLETRNIYSGAKEAGRELPGVKYRQWYDSLRTTDILIRSAVAWADGSVESGEKTSLWFKFLADFLGKFVGKDKNGNRTPQDDDKDFWCGVCAQLEQVSLTANESARGKTAELVGDLLLPNREIENPPA